MPKATDTMKTGLALPADAGQAWDATDAPKPAQNGTERVRPDPEVMRERHWRDALRRRMLAFADTLSVLAAALLMELALTANDPLLEWCLLSLPLWVVLAKLHGLYDKDHRVLLHTTADDLPRLAAWSTMGTAGLALALALSATPSPRDRRSGLLWRCSSSWRAPASRHGPSGGR